MATGAGLAQARWVPNRGVLLLLYAECLIVYDTELGTVMERVALPRRCRPFKRWLAAEGGGACLGNADEGALSTLVAEHEARCTYSLHCYVVCPLLAGIRAFGALVLLSAVLSYLSGACEGQSAMQVAERPQSIAQLLA